MGVILCECDGVTFLHKSRGRPTRGTTTPPRQPPPGTPAAALQHRRTDADRPSIPKTSHSGPTRDHGVPVRYYLILIPSRQILPSHLARLPSSPPDTHRPPPPPARYTTASSQKLPRAAFKSRPSRHHLPPCRSARDVLRLHQLTAAAGEEQFRREANLYHRPLGVGCEGRCTDPHTPPPASPVKTPPPQPGSAQRQIRCRDITVDINGSGPVVTSHQPANRLLPLSPNSEDRRRPLGRCQSVRVSAPGRVMTLRRAADTIPAAAPCRPSRSGAGNDR